MTGIETSIENVRRAHDRLGSKKFAKASGVPYSTLREALARDFVGPSIATLIKLAAVAEDTEAGSEPKGVAA